MTQTNDLSAFDELSFAEEEMEGVSEEAIHQFFYTPATSNPTLLDMAADDVTHNTNIKINAAYTALKVARNGLFAASEHEGRCKDALEVAERDLLLSGAIDGKNAELRNAQMFNRTEVQRTQLYQAQSKRRRAELDLQLATDEVQRIRTLVSLITVQA
jgi:hypothetical protein